MKTQCKTILSTLIILLTSCFSIGQKKQLDFIKTIKYSPIDYSENADLVILSVYLEKEDPNDRSRMTKELSYLPNSKLDAYTLESYGELETIYIYWRKDEIFYVAHEIIDTISANTLKIEFEISLDSLEFGSITNEYRNLNKTDFYKLNQDDKEYYNLDKTDFYKLNQDVIDYYKNWCNKYIGLTNSLQTPEIYNWKKLTKEKLKWEIWESIKQGDTLITTNYDIDSVFSNKSIQIDTIFKGQRKHLFKRNNNVITSYEERRQIDENTIDSYSYDSISNNTNQRLTKVIKNDTLYDIKIKTFLEEGNYISHYDIIGNHPLEYTYMNNKSLWLKFDTLRKRTIHIIRDSNGYIFKGNALAISSNGDTLTCTVYSRPSHKVNYENDIQLVERQTPYKLYFKESNLTVERKFDIVSIYPNIDLVKLGKANLILKEGIMANPEFKILKRKTKRRSQNRKTNTLIPPKHIRKKSKRVKSELKKVKKWKEDDYMGYTIYEYHYK
ncbi:MAG: hypothetical protein PHQ74_09290 [Crocinitomicaceae bacterium]|nr:hypothetical protein [Crocinitomicaceae bacterium]